MPARLFGTAEYCQRATYILKMNKNEMNQNSRCEEFTSAGCFHPEIFTDLRKFNLLREQTLKKPDHTDQKIHIFNIQKSLFTLC